MCAECKEPTVKRLLVERFCDISSIEKCYMAIQTSKAIGKLDIKAGLIFCRMTGK